MLGLMNAAAFLPSPIAAFLADWIGHHLGRRYPVWIGSVLTLAGGLINATSRNMGQYIAGRAFMGFGTSMTLTVGPTLCQEIAHPRYRAQVGSLYTCIYYIAAICSAFICFGTRFIDSEYSWRIPCYFQILGPIAALLMTFNMPESPRWLWKKGKIAEATRILGKYHANGDENDPLVQLECEEIKQALEDEEANSQTRYMDYFKTPGNRRRLFVVCIIAVGTNWVGNGIISYYLTPILASVGITETIKASGINIGLQFWNLGLSVWAALSVDSLGRRPLWLLSTIGMMLSFCIVMALSAEFAKTGSSAIGTATIPFLFGNTADGITQIFFGFYEYPVEILPFNLRTKGQAIFIAVQTAAVALNTFANPVALAALEWRYYGVYIGILAVLSVIIYFYFPETKNMTIDVEEISIIFDTGRTGNAQAATARLRRAAQTNANAEVRSIREDYGGKNDSDANTPIESLPN
ncbi:hypothetical protein JCM24511_02626 [Saitozyma sp. JCM 24511]|nr:hypothetical protein JCM24511_02626 [Saitozyma sp. JCM 24511]